MHKRDFKLSINSHLWAKAQEKIQTDFGKKFCQTDCALIVLLLACYKRKNKPRSIKNICLVLDTPDEREPKNYTKKTLCLYVGLMEKLKVLHPGCNNSEIFEFALADFLYLPANFYTDSITSLYSIVGSKNKKMQGSTAKAVSSMKLNVQDLTLIDGCCATGSLFFGLKTYPWKQVILNDMNPLRTNFLNVIKSKPLQLIKKILDMDLSFIKYRDQKNGELRKFKEATDTYLDKRKKYKKVDCNVDIAFQMFLKQCIDKKPPENSERIFERVFRFLPAHLKLQNARITQADCLTYLKNDSPKFLLLDVPYIGSEQECSVKGYRYAPFHEKVAKFLQEADYPFIYYCRSSAPKSDKSKPTKEKETIMRMELGQLFFDKGFYFEKVRLSNDTELMVSNQNYNNDTQFQWTEFHQGLL
ncbi:DNA adenine methylase [Lachnospiraceae bacterium 45-W7]